MHELRMQGKRVRCFVSETTNKVTSLTAFVMSQKSRRNWDNTAYKLWSNLQKTTFTQYWLACGCRGCYLCLRGYLTILEGWGTELDIQGMTPCPPPPPLLLYVGNIVEMEIRSCKKSVLGYSPYNLFHCCAILNAYTGHFSKSSQIQGFTYPVIQRLQKFFSQTWNVSNWQTALINQSF